MSVFDDLCGKALSSVLGGGGSNPLAASVLQMINNQPGGLAGLVQSFREKGLGDVVNSWVSTGQNLPISADQVKQALGSERVQEIAQQNGISAESASSNLSAVLPALVNMLTPNGELPQHNNLMDMCSSILSSFNKGTAA